MNLINLTDMTLNQYMQLSELDKRIIDAKLLHAFKNSEVMFKHLFSIIKLSEDAGLYNDVKFGNDVYKPEIIGIAPLS